VSHLNSQPIHSTALQFRLPPLPLPTHSSSLMEAKSKGGSYNISCTECHRRKQKCSRSWPCNHCTTRKVAHLCQFPPKKSATDSESPKSDLQELGKRKLAVPEVDEVDDEVDEEASAAHALKVLGYLQIDAYSPFWGCSGHPENEHMSRETQEALTSIPLRQYCDTMVQNYLEDSNYQYYLIYPPKFLEDCNQWWDMRSKGQEVSASLTCLILRVLACSAQSFTTPTLRIRLESELGIDAQTMTDRYQRAAQKLSDRIPPGVGGITQVQQLFMSAVWHKSETLFIESWHALSAAIRQAQEIGSYYCPSLQDPPQALSFSKSHGYQADRGTSEQVCTMIQYQNEQASLNER
jgi:hypothetical protein